MARSTFHRLIKKTKTTTMESLKGQYKHFEAIMAGKRLYKEVKTKRDLIETGLRNEIDCDTMDQNCYDELHMTPNIEKSIPGKHANEMSFTLKDDAGVKLSASGSSHEQTPLRASCLSGDVDSVREILNKQKDCEGNIALMLAVSGGHQDLVGVLIKEFNFNANTSQGSDGRTPLHQACFIGHTDLVRQLVVWHGADVGARDNDNWDALMYAVDGGHQVLVRVLIKEFHFNANISRGSDGRTPLLEACFEGYIDLVRELVVEHGADLSAKDNDNYDALMYAVIGGHQHLVRVLIKEFHFNANTCRGRTGSTPLLGACISGHIDLLRELVVEHGADLSAKDNDSDDALMYAVIGGHKDLVRVLIKEFQFSANMSRGGNGRTPLLEACIEGHIDLVRELVVEHGADLSAKDNDNDDALMYAVIGGHKDLVRVLIKEFQFSANMSRGGNGRTPLHQACIIGHTDLVRELVVEHGADLSAKGEHNRDALMYAASNGHQELVRVLIKEFHFNANTSRNSNGRTPLHQACFKGHTDLVRELVVEHGADLGAKDNDNWDALMYAVSGGHQVLVRVLIKDFHFSANRSQGSDGRTPLHQACFKGHTDLVRQLVVEHGADVGARDNDNWDALMYAVAGGHQELVGVLIKEFHFNANTSRNSNRRTPLHQACIKGHTDLVRQLVVEHGADLSAKGEHNRDALMYAVSGGHQVLVRVLIKDFHFSANRSDGRTPLHQACFKGHTDLVRQLVVEHGADVGARDNDNWDALMYAVAGGHQELVRALIKEFHFNANMSRNSNGRTPLHQACIKGHTDLVRELVVEHGADLGAKDNDNWDALMYAVAGGHTEIVKILMNDFGFRVNAIQGLKGETPLLVACKNGHTYLVIELVYEYGAEVDAKDADGNNALMYAVIGNHRDIAELSINVFGFDVNAGNLYGCTPLLMAFYHNHIDLAMDLIYKFESDVYAQDMYGHNCLMYAAQGGSLIAARFLLTVSGFDVNARGHCGETALLVACYYGHISFVTYLFAESEHSLDLIAEDEHGNNALMYAVDGCQEAAVRFLVEEYAFDVNSSNHALQTPVILASMKGNVGLFNILVKELGASLLCEDENGDTAFSIAVSEGQQNIVDLLVSILFNDVEKWLAANFFAYYPVLILECSIDSMMAKFLHKVDAIPEHCNSEMISDVEMSYIGLIQQTK